MKETDKQNQHQGNYTYIVKCSDETLYTGWTNNLKKRLEAHNSGKGAKYTKNRRPVELVYFEEYDTKQEAMKREYAIKQLSRQKKLALIRSHQSIFLKMFWEIAVNEAGFLNLY